MIVVWGFVMLVVLGIAWGCGTESGKDLDKWSIAGKYLRDDNRGSYIRLDPINYQEFNRATGRMEFHESFQVDSNVLAGSTRLIGPISIALQTSTSWTLYHQPTRITLIANGKTLLLVDSADNSMVYLK